MNLVNAVFAYTLTVSMAVAFVVSMLTPVLLTHLPEVNKQHINIDVDKVSLAYGRYDPFFQVAQMKEYAFIEATLNADLSPLFHWNTKQLFLALVLRYDNKRFSQNDLVIWDDILMAGDEAHLDGVTVTNKYAVTDIDTDGFKRKNGSLYLKWEVVPHFGMSQRDQGKTFQFDFPSQYVQQ